MGRTRNGHISEAVGNQFRVNGAINVDKDTISGEPLRAVACYGVSMIEVPHLAGVEHNGFAIVHAYGELSVPVYALNRAEVAVSNAEVSVRGR